MTIQPSINIVADYPAFSVVRMEGMGAHPIARDGVSYRVLIGGHWTAVSFNCLAWYAKDAEELARFEQRGEKTHWCNVQASVLTSHRREKEACVGLMFGDEIEIDGARFTLAPARNGNVALEPVKGPEPAEQRTVWYTVDGQASDLYDEPRELSVAADANLKDVARSILRSAPASRRLPIVTIWDSSSRWTHAQILAQASWSEA